MQMSATKLGRFYGLTGEEMNRILFKQGFLDGIPSDYTITEKGAQYATEYYHPRGNGGYSRYNVGWTTVLYDDSITEELNITDEDIEEVRTELSTKRQRRKAERTVAREDTQEMIISSDENDSEEDRNEIIDDFESCGSQITENSVKEWIIGLGIVVIGITIFKTTLYVKNRLQNRKIKLRRQI